MSLMPDAAPQNDPSTSRRQPLVVILAAVTAGILADRFHPLPLSAWWATVAVGLALWMTLQLLERRFFDRAAWAAVLGNFLVLAAIAATAGAWHHCRWNLMTDDDLGRYALGDSRPICVEAVAVESPRRLPPAADDPMRTMPRSESSRLAVDLLALRNGAAWQPVSGRATLLIAGSPPTIAPGDRLRCFGRLSAPEGPQNPGDRDDAAFLRADRVYGRLKAEVRECVSVVQSGSAWNLSRLLEIARSHCNAQLERYLNPRRAELAAAVLLGLREELDVGRNEAFLTTGTIHILSISGLHVGILAAALYWGLGRLPISRGWIAAAVAAVTLFYAMMVDVGPPVVRATVLVLIGCWGVWLSRRPLGFNSLAAAALVVLALNPAHLFHVGAQLSFLCVAGLVWLSRRRPHANGEIEAVARTLKRLEMQNLNWFSRRMQGLSRSVIGLFLAGVFLWFLTTPLVLARFHILSPAAMVFNILLWIPMTLSLVSGFGVMLFGAVCPPLGVACGWLCDLNFAMLEGCVETAHRMPYSHFWLPGPADWWLWGFYGALGLAAAFPRLLPPRRWRLGLLAAWIAVGFATAGLRHDRGRLDCTFLSVGHGAAVSIEFPSGQTMLYDAGKMGAPAAGARTISKFLWDRGLFRLDAVVLSHPDTDHYNALPGLLEKFSVGAIYVSPQMFESDSRTVVALRRAIDRHGVPLREARAGDRLDAGGDCTVEVLHPSRRGALSLDNMNNVNSLVLSVEHRGRRILLPGDLESPGLDDVLAEEPRRCEVLLAPHHGSRKSNSPALAAWCRPRFVVLSGDGRWSGVPEIEATYRAVGGQTLHTCRSGAIRVCVDDRQIEVSEFVKPGIYP